MAAAPAATLTEVPASKARAAVPDLRAGLACSAAIHLAVGALLFVGFRNAAPPPPPAPAAMAIQLTPEPAAPPQAAHQNPVGPQQVQSPPRPVPETPDELPPLPTVANAPADAVVQPKRVETPPAKEQPKQQEADRTMTPSAPPLPPRPVAGAPLQGTSSATADRAEQTWEGLVLARLEGKKRYPGEAQRAGQQDIVYVRIATDRSGKVISAKIEQSRHFALLDAAVLDLVKRSSPLPRPPASVTEDPVEFVVPVKFFVNPGNRR